jgi:hypothetical protein
MRRQKSESGAALILTVSIIGLFFIVTVGSFLLASSLNQDSARLSSAKIDVSSREDTLMRAVLQQLALGMQPGASGSSSTWTTIMTAAVNQVLATQYVDPAEITQIFGASAPTVVNTGDTGGTSLAIFQGYQQEVPFGGTVGVANLVTSYDSTVQPPELTWVANANISAGAAATNPLPFFLGSQMSAAGSAATSPAGRWSVIPFPNINFGFMRAGDSMVARRVWWRVPAVYSTTQQTIENPANVYRYRAVAANYIVSIYEIPSQLPITGNANLQLGLFADGTSWGDTTSASNSVYIASSSSSSGSIYGDSVQLSGTGGKYGGGISSRRQVNVTQQATVNGQTYNNNTYDDLGVLEQSALTSPIGAAPISVAGDDGKVLLVPILPGLSFYNSAPGVPTAWDLYARPYYHCPIRITISGTNSSINYSGGVVNTTGTAGAITVTLSYLPDVSGQPDSMFGVLDSATGWTTRTYQQTSNATGNGYLVRTDDHSNSPCNFFVYTTTASGVSGQDINILEIDLQNLYANLALVPSQCYSIYVSAPLAQNTSNTAYPQNTNFANVGVALTDGDDLGLFTNGLSMVSPQRVYLTGSFNNGGSGVTGASGIKVATSVYAPDLRYGIDQSPVQINMAGQISISQVNESSGTTINPLNFSNAGGNSIVGSGNTYKLNAITNPRALPPITRLNLLFTVEKERPN